MNLSTALKIQAPLVWVVTDEIGRAFDEVAELSPHHVYRVGTKGLLLWEKAQRRWLRVLTEGPEDNLVPIFHFNAALEYISQHGGVLIVPHAHLQVKQMFGEATELVEQFRATFRNDDTTHNKLQLLFLSHESQVPPEIARDVIVVKLNLPESHEITQIFERVPTYSLLNKEERANLTRVAKGLTETEIMRATANSLAEHGNLDLELINRYKVEALQAGGVLEVQSPKMDLADIGGLDKAKELIQAVAWTWHDEAGARALGIEPLRRILMVGVPGTGKSAICEATAKSLRLELARTGVSKAMSKWVGESEANMRRVFRQIEALAPICMWIDEFGRDLSGGASSGDVDGGTTDRVHGEFLTGLQELPKNVFLMCAANRIDSLPPEMLRADRFDKILFVGLPTESERAEIFKIHLGEQRERYDVALLAAATPTYTGAEIKALIREVRFRIGSKHRRPPRTDEIIDAVPQLKGRIWQNHRAAIVQMYQRAVAEWEFASSEQEADAELVLAAAGYGKTNPSKYSGMLKV